MRHLKGSIFVEIIILFIILMKKITENKRFWKTVTVFLSDKVLWTERITLIENDKIINNNNETAIIMETFFSNIIINQLLPEYHNCEVISGNIPDFVK